jgi:multiple sugar transport system substrate-binding protein
MYQQLADWWNKYEEPSTGITIRLKTVAGGASEGHTAMLQAAQNGGSGYDIYNLDSEWITEFADSGYITPLAGHSPGGGYLPGPLHSAEDASGHLFAAPFTTDVGLLYYRSDLVKPSQEKKLHSFADVINEAQAVMGSRAVMRKKGLQEGYAGQFDSYEGLTVNALEVLRYFDPQVFASNGTVHGSRNVEALTAGLDSLVNAFTAKPGSPRVIPPAELKYQESQAFSDFAAGRTVFMRNWPVYYPQLRKGNEPGTTFAISNKFQVAPLPFPSVLGGQDLAIASGSQDKSGALAVMRFLTSAPAERCLLAVGGFPATRQSAYQGSALPLGYGTVHHPLCGSRPGPSLEIAPYILKAVRAALPRPAARYYTEFSDIVQRRVSALLSLASRDNTGSSVTDTVDALSADLQAAATGHLAPR